MLALKLRANREILTIDCSEPTGMVFLVARFAYVSTLLDPLGFPESASRK